MTFAGCENERFLHICKNDAGAMLCDVGSFIWVKFVEVGISRNYTNDEKGDITCPRNQRTDCSRHAPLEDFYDNRGSRWIHKIGVPDKTVPCNGGTRPTNFIHITFSCIEGKWQWYQYTACFGDYGGFRFTLRYFQHVYCQTSNIKLNKSQNVNVSCLVVQLFLHNLLKPGVKWRMKM